VSQRYIFQPLAMKRLYLSVAHDRAIVERALDVMESVLRGLAPSHAHPARGVAPSIA